MRRSTWKVCLSLAACALITLSVPVIAGQEVPFKGTETGAITLVGGSPPFLTFSGTFAGVASHLGSYTREGTVTIDLRTLSFSGPTTFTAANGDTLTGTTSGAAVPISPTVSRQQGTITITGGTGRFEGATGSVAFSGQITRIDATTLQSALSFSGTLSSVGSSKG